VSSPAGSAVTETRHGFAAGVIGGSATVIDYGHTRLVSDPVFSPPGQQGPLTKITGPALPPERLGDVDAVLLSHDDHFDNFDQAARDWVATAGMTVITGPAAAARLGPRARGIPWGSHTTLPRGDGHADITVHAVEAVHGPLDGETDPATGAVNAQTTGFVLRADGLPTVYVSGDNASIVPVIGIARTFPDIEAAVLHVGAARNAAKLRDRPVSLTAERAADVALLLGVTTVIPAHYEGWAIYTQGLNELRHAFDDAGAVGLLALAPLGTWTLTAAPVTKPEASS
jgi:L-ascorbate metabolism protein UlaG (beta-lactamase superfamily)